MPFFSIIIPVYNKESFIENTIKSVLQQHFTDFELIIINDGSTDDSEIKIKAFSDPRITFHSKENGGVSTARNLGIEMARASYITFLDADDFWYPNFLEEMKDSISDFPNEKIFSAAIETEVKSTIFPAKYSIKKTKQQEIVNYFDASMNTTAICTSCAVFHKSIFEEVGNFDSQLQQGEDTDLWIRMGLHYAVVFNWKILACYVYDPKSLSKNKNFLSQKRIFSKFVEIEKNNHALKKFLDYNRYSLALKSKMNNNKSDFKEFAMGIDKQNLSLKKTILLRLPSWILRILIATNKVLVNIGLIKSFFK